MMNTAASQGALDLEEDTPELEGELLKAARGPPKPYSPDDLRVICERIVQEKRQKPVYPGLRQR